MSKYSIVVPTYKEQGNVASLTSRLFAALESNGYGKGSAELIFVDDNSRDGTEDTVKSLSANYNVRIIVRVKERGLSSAVIRGIEEARGEFIVVMDADLQHPPETVPSIFTHLEKPGVEFVLGTRYGGSVAIDKDWPLHRRVISWGARILARPLTPLSDPMSGFFALRRDVYRRGAAKVSAIGYKIALELFVKCHVRKFSEVPFSFAARSVGESKLTGKVILHYIKHLYALYVFSFGMTALVLMVLLILAVAFFVLRWTINLLH